jgi:hypothetical protein
MEVFDFKYVGDGLDSISLDKVKYKVTITYDSVSGVYNASIAK